MGCLSLVGRSWAANLDSHQNLFAGVANVKYLLLIYGNEQSRQVWDQLSAEDRLTGLSAYDELTAELTDAGELVAAEALADPSTGRRVRITDDQQVVLADGPFAEVKELVSGFYLIDCDTEERAIAIAAKVPEAAFGLVEVRPVMALDDFVT